MTDGHLMAPGAEGRPRRLPVLAVTLLLVVTAAGCPGDGSTAGSSGPGTGSRTGGSVSSPSPDTTTRIVTPTETACDLVRSPLTPFVVNKLLGLLTKGAYSGGLASKVLLSYVKTNCNTLLPQAVKATQSFFGTSPQTLRLPDLPTLQAQFTPTPATLLAVQLQNAGFRTVTSAQVEALATNLCDDALGRRRTTSTTASAATADLQALLPGADLRMADELDRLYAVVLAKPCRLSTYQADGLLWELTGYLLSNERVSGIADVLPPIVAGPTWTRAGASSITLRWSAFDAAGVRSYDLWVLGGGTWTSLLAAGTRTTMTVDNLTPSVEYQFALRAVDVNDNASGWSYMTPCLTCP